MDIIIKSFNRPFYLDRCIASITKYVSGKLNIIVLDDGTPKQYLDKILSKYPNVDIRHSDNYEKKLNAIEENLKSGKPINGFEIPTKFWYENIEKASDYVIVTEDDVWFTNPINVDELQKEAQTLDINLIKLGWLGNEKDSENLDLKSISENLNSALPKDLLLFPKPLMSAFFTNQFKFFTILYKLGQVDHKTQRKYWALNSILMGFFNKNYWLKIWEEMDGKVDEKKQLLNASLFYKKNRSKKNFVSRLKKEAMKTTFQSSATNSYHEYGFDFDVNRFNHIINEAWLKGDFDPMENFPNDFSSNYFKNFVSDKINFAEFEKWANKFKTQYQQMGCKID